jgi:hypothetical protein
MGGGLLGMRGFRERPRSPGRGPLLFQDKRKRKKRKK